MTEMPFLWCGAKCSHFSQEPIFLVWSLPPYTDVHTRRSFSLPLAANSAWNIRDACLSLKKTNAKPAGSLLLLLFQSRNTAGISSEYDEHDRFFQTFLCNKNTMAWLKELKVALCCLYTYEFVFMLKCTYYWINSINVLASKKKGTIR